MAVAITLARWNSHYLIPSQPNPDRHRFNPCGFHRARLGAGKLAVHSLHGDNLNDAIISHNYVDRTLRLRRL